ncbi:hypothetical protein LZC95_08365 [Pendulispora brunnea]|uniref:DUF416 family protein n=1 Tax=Pendulispora brunnea TaxID=2905690 RepID=A0ABZ2KIS5_9BACT
MDAIDSAIARLQRISATARIALAAEIGDRVYPIYEEYWIGTYSNHVRRSIDLAWSRAEGGVVDQNDLRSCQADIEDLVAFYGEEEENDLLRAVVTVVLRVLQSLSSDSSESDLAVARALLEAQNVAQAAEAMADEAQPSGKEIAALEEEEWQDRALAFLDSWKGPPHRHMFDAVGGRPAKWLEDWRARTANTR